MREIWVVKLGGSLAESGYLNAWLTVLGSFGGGRVIIVPGGGPFADEVRRLQRALRFDDRAAHRMALLAMEQYGLAMIGLCPDLQAARGGDTLRNVLCRGGVAVWMPSAMVTGEPKLIASWDLTSDSLAAWLANLLNADLLMLVKSAPVPADIDAIELARRGLVDRLFPAMIANHRYPTRVIESDEAAAMQRMLATGAPAGRLVRPGKGAPASLDD